MIFIKFYLPYIWIGDIGGGNLDRREVPAPEQSIIFSAYTIGLLFESMRV